MKGLQRLQLEDTEISLEGYRRLREGLPEASSITPPKDSYDTPDFAITLRVTDVGGTPIANANVTVTDFFGFKISVGSKATRDESPRYTGKTNDKGETPIFFHDFEDVSWPRGHWRAFFLVEAAGHQSAVFIAATPPAVTVCRLRRDGCPLEGRVENIPASWTQPLVVIAAPSLPLNKHPRALPTPYEWAIAKADVARDGSFKFPPLPPGDYQLNILAAATAQWPWGEDDTRLHLLRNAEDREKAADQEKPRYLGNLGEAKLTLPLEGPYPGPVALRIEDDVAAIYVKDEKDRPVVDARLDIEWDQRIGGLSYYPGSDGSIYYPIRRSEPRKVTLYYDKVADEYTRQTMLFASWWSAGESSPEFLPDPDNHHFDYFEKNRKEPIRVKRNHTQSPARR
jgi:hypothetical protein